MSNLFRSFAFASLALAVVVSTVAAQQPGRQRGPGGPGGFRSPTQLPRDLELTDDQKAKIADIEKKFADKVKAAQAKAELTEEQRGKMRDVFTKAREANTPREEMQAFIAKELGLSDDQKKGREELNALTAEITKEVESVLTDDQKAKLRELRSQRGGQGRRPGGDRKKAE
jgi:Spy/CpxP family protein refolding chaperone